jgi:uncharacterized membrane protein YgcG
VRYLFRLAAAAALLLLLATPALAQGRVLIRDAGGRLDAGDVQQAARPLVNKGATVAVYVVDSGDGDDFMERLIDDGLARSDGAMLTNVIGIYIAINDRYSEIAYGDDWAEALAVNNNAEAIRVSDLNPGLSAGDFTRGVSEALAAIDDAIDNPPVPGGGTNVDTFPIAASLAAIAAAGGGAYLFSRRRRTAKLRAAAQQRLKDAREGAGALIAELGRRFSDAAEKARYDQVSYAAADVAHLSELQGAAVGRFVKVQEQFDTVGEQLERYEKPSNEQLATAAAGFDQVKAEAEAVSADLQTVEQLRAELDERARSAREELDRAKKA